MTRPNAARHADAQAALDAPRWIATMAEFAAGPHREMSDLDPKVVDRVTTMMADTVSNHVRPAAVAPQHVIGSWERLGEIGVPVLAVIGELDASDHIAMSERPAKGVADGRVVRIAGTAHYPMLERPDQWSRTVEGFLATIPEFLTRKKSDAESRHDHDTRPSHPRTTRKAGSSLGAKERLVTDTIIAGRRRADQRPSLITRAAAGTPQRRADTPRATAIPMRAVPDVLSPLVFAGTAVLLTVILMIVTR